MNWLVRALEFPATLIYGDTLSAKDGHMTRLTKWAAVKFDSFGNRLFLLDEIDRLERAGRFIPPDAKRLVFRTPSRYDDFVQLMCFFDNRKAVNLIDVGANVGEFSLDFHHFFPTNDFIYCFEPNPTLRTHLEATLQNIPNVAPFAVGVGDEKSVMTLSVPKKKATLGSFLKFNTEANAHYQTTEADDYEVTVDRLDDLLEERHGPTLVKIDVQGFEEKVLLGGRSTIGRSDAVLLECSFAPMHVGAEPTFNTCASILFNWGFVPVVFQRYGVLINTYAFERDVLFVKKVLTPKIYHENY
jgi:FkbM family methyltransferase